MMERDMAQTRQTTAKGSLNPGWTLSSLDFDQLYSLWLDRAAAMEGDRAGEVSQQKRYAELMEVEEQIAKTRSKTLRDLAIKLMVSHHHDAVTDTEMDASIHKDALAILADI